MSKKKPGPAALAAKALAIDDESLAALSPVLTSRVRKKNRGGSLTLNLDSASDIVQDFYVREFGRRRKAAEKLPTEAGPSVTPAAGHAAATGATAADIGYYGGAVMNEAFGKRRKNKRKKRVIDRAVQAGSAVLNGLAGRSETPSQVAVFNEQAPVLLAAPQSLTPTDRALWERVNAVGKKWKKIGPEFDLTPAAARMKWTRLDAAVRAAARLSGGR